MESTDEAEKVAPKNKGTTFFGALAGLVATAPT